MSLQGAFYVQPKKMDLNALPKHETLCKLSMRKTTEVYNFPRTVATRSFCHREVSSWSDSWKGRGLRIIAAAGSGCNSPVDKIRRNKGKTKKKKKTTKQVLHQTKTPETKTKKTQKRKRSPPKKPPKWAKLLVMPPTPLANPALGLHGEDPWDFLCILHQDLESCKRSGERKVGGKRQTSPEKPKKRRRSLFTLRF